MKNGWYKPRSYQHFDCQLSKEKAERYVTNKNRVSRHAFYPFLHYVMETKKLKAEGNELSKKPKTRDIYIASHIDSHIYSYYSQKLMHYYERELCESNLCKNILAFRALGKNNIDFAKEAFEIIKSKKNCVVICLDISGFFDNLDHGQLKKSWAKMLKATCLPSDHYNVFKSITKFSWISKKEVAKVVSDNAIGGESHRICSLKNFRNVIKNNCEIKKNKHKKQIPQGSPISATLSNIYMFDFDLLIKKSVEENGGEYLRYCDDMMFILPAESELDIEYFARQEINNIGLTINEDKTEIRNFREADGGLRCDKPVQYLGFVFDGKRILLRSSGLSKFSRKMKAAVRRSKRKYKKLKYEMNKSGKQISCMYKKDLYENYSHLSKKKRCYVSYALKAADKMKSKAIRKQVKPLWNRLNREINE